MLLPAFALDALESVAAPVVVLNLMAMGGVALVAFGARGGSAVDRAGGGGRLRGARKSAFVQYEQYATADGNGKGNGKEATSGGRNESEKESAAADDGAASGPSSFGSPLPFARPPYHPAVRPTPPPHIVSGPSGPGILALPSATPPHADVDPDPGAHAAAADAGVDAHGATARFLYTADDVVDVDFDNGKPLPLSVHGAAKAVQLESRSSRSSGSAVEDFAKALLKAANEQAPRAQSGGVAWVAPPQDLPVLKTSLGPGLRVGLCMVLNEATKQAELAVVGLPDLGDGRRPAHPAWLQDLALLAASTAFRTIRKALMLAGPGGGLGGGLGGGGGARRDRGTGTFTGKDNNNNKGGCRSKGKSKTDGCHLQCVPQPMRNPELTRRRVELLTSELPAARAALRSASCVAIANDADEGELVPGTVREFLIPGQDAVQRVVSATDACCRHMLGYLVLRASHPWAQPLSGALPDVAPVALRIAKIGADTIAVGFRTPVRTDDTWSDVTARWTKLVGRLVQLALHADALPSPAAPRSQAQVQAQAKAQVGGMGPSIPKPPVNLSAPATASAWAVLAHHPVQNVDDANLITRALAGLPPTLAGAAPVPIANPNNPSQPPRDMVFVLPKLLNPTKSLQEQLSDTIDAAQHMGVNPTWFRPRTPDHRLYVTDVDSFFRSSFEIRAYEVQPDLTVVMPLEGTDLALDTRAKSNAIVKAPPLTIGQHLKALQRSSDGMPRKRGPEQGATEVYVFGPIEGRTNALVGALLELKIIERIGTRVTTCGSNPDELAFKWIAPPTMYVVQCGDQISRTAFDKEILDLETLVFTDYLAEISDGRFVNVIGDAEWLDVRGEPPSRPGSSAPSKFRKTAFYFDGLMGKIVRRRRFVARVDSILFSYAGVVGTRMKWNDEDIAQVNNELSKFTHFTSLKSTALPGGTRVVPGDFDIDHVWNKPNPNSTVLQNDEFAPEKLMGKKSTRLFETDSSIRVMVVGRPAPSPAPAAAPAAPAAPPAPTYTNAHVITQDRHTMRYKEIKESTMTVVPLPEHGLTVLVASKPTIGTATSPHPTTLRYFKFADVIKHTPHSTRAPQFNQFKTVKCFTYSCTGPCNDDVSCPLLDLGMLEAALESRR